MVQNGPVFGVRLRESLKRAGVTLTEAGGWLGVTHQAVMKWCNGGTISLESAIVLADKLGLSLDWLTGRTDDPGQRLSAQEQAWVAIGRAIQEDGPEAVARFLDPKPEYAKPLGPPVVLKMND